LRAEGFSPVEKKISSGKFLSILVIKTLDLDLDPVLYLAKMLDPDPDLINPDPQHCRTTRRSFVKHINFFPELRLNLFILLTKFLEEVLLLTKWRFVLLLLEEEGGGGVGLKYAWRVFGHEMGPAASSITNKLPGSTAKQVQALPPPPLPVKILCFSLKYIS
jgi:hypothetical protein